MLPRTTAAPVRHRALTTEAWVEAAARRDDERRSRPLIVDLDGTLVRTDTTLECAVALAGRPATLLRALAAWRHGRAQLKQELAAAAALDPSRLPYHRQLLDYLRAERAAGRRLVLATGADSRIAAAVAEHLGLFDAVLASDGRINLTGAAKLAAIRRTLGDSPFGYVGNSRADLAVWREAADGVCVNAGPRVARAAAQVTLIAHSFPRERGGLRRLLETIRPQR
jgi:phosphoserine phosphatase